MSETAKRRIVLASSNKNKLREVRQILEGSDLEVIPLSETEFAGEIIEDGKTFEENAYIKAKTVSDALGVAALADDSGLEIDALGKEPGVHSARFMGEDTSYDIKNTELLRRMEGVAEQDRTARFVCAMVVVWPDGKKLSAVETMEGRIAYKIAGENGFGYDPIFFLPEYGKTSAEIAPEEKNAISHRGKALRKMAQLLREA
ncbi:MAG: XTP/dITP diphosphatase [Lachnospiraceae bacterium]|nr:XTP/dITP diphosphatase [Lachnospiraceae bacterium]